MPDEIIGGSPAIRRLRAALPRLATETGPIVITGETGTGKTLFASHIHVRSDRSSYDLEVVNFSLLSERDQRIAILGGGPPELTTTRRSVLEIPTTVVLKHVDRASPFIQQTLAGILSSREILRPGAQESHRLSARIVFTLRHTLPSLFRGRLPRGGRIPGEGRALDPSLYEILKSSRHFNIPPLRKRPSDIPLLAEHFLRHIPHSRGLTRRGSLDSSLKRILLKQRWLGNVTELRAYLNSLAVQPFKDAVEESEKIEIARILQMLDQGSEFSLSDSLAAIETSIIHRALDRCDGNQHRAALLLGLTDRSIRRKGT